MSSPLPPIPTSQLSELSSSTSYSSIFLSSSKFTPMPSSSTPHPGSMPIFTTSPSSPKPLSSNASTLLTSVSSLTTVAPALTSFLPVTDIPVAMPSLSFTSSDARRDDVSSSFTSFFSKPFSSSSSRPVTSITSFFPSSSSTILPSPSFSPNLPTTSVSFLSVSSASSWAVNPNSITSEPSSLSAPHPITSSHDSMSPSVPSTISIKSSSASSGIVSETSQTESTTPSASSSASEVISSSLSSSSFISASSSFLSSFLPSLSSTPPQTLPPTPTSLTVLTTGLTVTTSSPLATPALTSTIPEVIQEEPPQNHSLAMLDIASSISTLSSRVFITTTNRQGVTITTAPQEITQTSTSTGPDGSLVTVTEIYSNPTLSPDNGTPKGSSFFSNVGAVASVFVLSGLAAASIILWVNFAMRRRRRNRRIEHTTAVSASLAAAGLYRTPLDDDEDDHNHNAVYLRHSGYGSTENPFQVRSMSGLPSDFLASAAQYDSRSLIDSTDEFALNPFEETDYIVPAGTREGYVFGNRLVLARTSTSNQSHNDSVKGNLEPLLASHHRTSLSTPTSPIIPLAFTSAGLTNIGGDASQSSTNPIQNSATFSFPHAHDLTNSIDHNDTPSESLMELAAASDSSVYSSDSAFLDDRLDPGLRQRLQHTSSSKSDLRDEEDYSRPIFGVRTFQADAAK